MDQHAIIFVEDDDDDRSLIKEAMTKINVDRQVAIFAKGAELIAFLQKAEAAPFLIVCDLALTGETGFDIRKSIVDDEELKYKSVPFIFWSTNASEKEIKQAYDLLAQGLFFKPSTFNDLCETLSTIISYWSQSKHPKRIS